MRGLHFIFLLIISVPVFSQSVYYEHYGVQNGLGQSQVSAMVQDHHGFVWVATRGGGLTRIGGKNFRDFRIEDGLQSNEVNDLLIRDKELIIASPRGILSLNLDTYQSTVLYESEENIMSLGEDNGPGFCFIEGYYKLFRFQDSTATPFVKDAHEPIRSFKNDEAGNLYLLSYRYNIYELADTTLQLVYSFKETGDFDFLPINKDSLYVIKGAKLHLTHPASGRAEVLMPGKPCCFIDRTEDKIWLFDLVGIRQLNRTGATSPATFPEELRNSRARRILLDAEGVLWIGTDGNGLFKIPGVPVVNYQHLSDDNLVIYNIAMDHEGKIFASSYNEGMFILKDGKMVDQLKSSGQLDFEYFRNVTFDLQNVPHLLFRRYGEFRMKIPGKLEKVPLPKGWPERLNAVTLNINERGDKIYDTDGGLFVAKKDSSYFLRTRNVVTSSAELGQDFFAVFTKDSLLFYKNGKPVSFKNARLEKETYVLKTVFDKANNRLFWSDLETGLYLYDFNSHQKINFTTRDGLHSQLIYNLIMDHKGYIWVGSERGFERISFSKDNKITALKYYGKYEGFMGVETNSNSMLADMNDNIWIGSIYGLYTLVDSLNTLPEKVYTPVLDSKSFIFDTLNVASYELESGRLILPHKLNNLKLTFHAVSQKYPNQAQMYYRWVNEEEVWALMPEDGTLFLTNLDIGKHMLEVKNALDQEEKHIMTYVIEVKPPFYKTWWFILLTVLILGYLAYRIQRFISNRKIQRAIQLRELREQTENEIRSQLGQDFHDEVGNRLAAISTQTGVLSLKMKNQGEAEKVILSQIQQNARKLYSDTKDFIWTINPDSSRFSEIVMYIKDVGEKLFEYAEMDFLCNSEITAGMNELILPSGQSMQLIMIFKEAMTNVLKHSGASKVNFSFDMHAKGWCIQLKDNGRGFGEISQENGHYGLKNMKFRAEKIKAKLEVSAEVSAGTTIKLTKDYE